MTVKTDDSNPPEIADDEGIDLSAGFVPKTATVVSELTQEELTPDSFMAQQAKLAAAAAELTFDSFMAEHGNDINSLEEPAADSGGEIGWRWASERDMPALQLLHFEAEVAAGRGMFLPDLSFPGAIAVCERDGKIIGGVFVEESATLTPIGMDTATLASVGDFIVPICMNLARKSGTRLLHSFLPASLAQRLDASTRKAGFEPVAPESVSYLVEFKPEDSNDPKRNTQ